MVNWVTKSKFPIDNANRDTLSVRVIWFLFQLMFLLFACHNFHSCVTFVYQMVSLRYCNKNLLHTQKARSLAYCKWLCLVVMKMQTTYWTSFDSQSNFIDEIEVIVYQNLIDLCISLHLRFPSTFSQSFLISKYWWKLKVTLSNREWVMRLSNFDSPRQTYISCGIFYR